MYWTQKVDFHSHFLPPAYYAYLDKYEGKKPDDFPTPKWDETHHLARIDRLGIAFAFLSVSSPNLSKADRETEIHMVHQINTEGAEIVQRHTNRLGLFASLPLPYTAPAIAEAEFTLSELKADGFALSTNYAGIYLGDPAYDPLLEYLDTVGAIVAVHPVEPFGMPKEVNSGLPIPAMEFFMDTTRTFTNMVMHDVFGRYPSIKWIFPHAGAFLPILSDRISCFAMQFKSTLKTPVPFDFKADMKRVYFDVAGFPVNKQLHDLLLDVCADNLLYGSDMPYTPDIACIAQTGGLETVSCMNTPEKEAMFTLNAVALVPRLADILHVSATGNALCYTNAPLSIREKCSRWIRSFIARVYHIIFQ